MALLLLLLSACNTPFWGGQEGSDLDDTGQTDSEETDTETDTETESGTDTADSGDTDTGDTDTGETGSGETGDTAPRTWSGSLQVHATRDGDGVADTCTGTVEIAEAGPAVAGTASCAFAGALAADWPKGLLVEISGLTDGHEGLSGTVTLTSGAASAALPWAGSITGAALDGAFAGPFPDASPTVGLQGTWTATRE